MALAAINHADDVGAAVGEFKRHGAAETGAYLLELFVDLG
jgi:hypothetical protein